MSVSSIAMTDAAPTAAPPLSPRRSSSFGGSQKDLYVAPEKKSVGEIMEQKEGEDEAMARYKAQLLGGAAAGAAVSEDGDKRRVVPVELRVLLEGRPDIVFDLETASVSTAAMAPMTFVLKEAANYRVQVSFRVQNEICSGLRYRQAVKRGVLTVDKTDEMLGSCAAQFRRNSSAQSAAQSAAHFSHRPDRPRRYGPDADKIHTVTFPKREWETAPSGMLARGTYAAAVTFVDDDKEQHAAFAYEFSIKKGWE